MQTFLPYPDFAESAHVLDRSRLGKQRVETIQVQRGLVVPGYGWRHHPAVKMWAGHEEALVRYGLEVCAAWRELGFPDTREEMMRSDLAHARNVVVVRTQQQLAEAGDLPGWLGDEDFHRSHRSALVRKFPAHYRRYFPDVPDDLPYVWPPMLTRTVNPSSSRHIDT